MAWLTYEWSRRPQPHRVDPESLEQFTPLMAALIRFNHEYRGKFLLPLDGTTLELLLEDDLAIVFERLPAWLQALAAGDGRQDLLFGSQGTELTLSAQRSGESVGVSARPLDPARWLPGKPLVISLDSFVRDWSGFLLAFLEELARFESALRLDAEWQDYRDRMLDIRRRVSP